MVALHLLGISKVHNFNSWSGSECQYAPSCQMLCRSVKPLPRYRNFIFLGCWLPPSWISLNFKFVTDRTVMRAELRHPAKFRWNRWKCGRDMAIFQFFNNCLVIGRGMSMLWGSKIALSNWQSQWPLTQGWRYRAACDNAECCADQSNRCRDIVILIF